MEQREMNRALDERLDEEIDGLLLGLRQTRTDLFASAQVAREFARLAAEESPRMSNAARMNGVNRMQRLAAHKRAARRRNPFAAFKLVPRWAQIAVVALAVVLAANGVSSAAADALPGSLWYPFKRLTEGGHLILQNTNGQRTALWMNLASTRLDEVQRLLNNGARVDPLALDAVDDSILRALTELAGTRGDERVALLQQLTALAVRQQQVVWQMAEYAPPEERARFEQTAKLLQGVAEYAASPGAATGVDGTNPLQFLTPTITPTSTLTPAPTGTPLPTATPLPTSTAAPTLIPTIVIGNLNNNAENGNDNGAVGVGNGNDNSDNDNGNDNNGNDNDNANDNGSDNGNDNDNDDDNGNGNENENDNDNENDNGDDGNGNDNGNDDGNDNNDEDDNSGPGNGNDNDGDEDNSGNDNGDEDDNSGKGNGGGGDNDDEDNSGKGNGGGDD
jgi:hypothetical protein